VLSPGHAVTDCTRSFKLLGGVKLRACRRVLPVGHLGMGYYPSSIDRLAKTAPGRPAEPGIAARRQMAQEPRLLLFPRRSPPDDPALGRQPALFPRRGAGRDRDEKGLPASLRLLRRSPREGESRAPAASSRCGRRIFLCLGPHLPTWNVPESHV
jgi:hypothetical protein